MTMDEDEKRKLFQYIPNYSNDSDYYIKATQEHGLTSMPPSTTSPIGENPQNVQSTNGGVCPGIDKETSRMKQ